MKLTVTVKQRSNGYEGSYQLPSSSVTKLQRKDGKTLFPNLGTLKQAGKRLSTSLKCSVEFAEPAKKAAKKSVKNKTAKTNKKSTKKAQAKKSATTKKAQAKSTTPQTQTPMSTTPSSLTPNPLS